MTARDAAFLGCRLMAMFWCIAGLIRFPFAIYGLREYQRYEQGGSDFFGLLVTTGLTESIGPLLASAFLFYGAGFISRVLVQGEGLQSASIDTRGALRVGIILVAIWTAAQFLPGLLKALTDWLFRRNFEPAGIGENWPTLVANVIGLAIIAIALIAANKMNRSQ